MLRYIRNKSVNAVYRGCGDWHKTQNQVKALSGAPIFEHDFVYITGRDEIYCPTYSRAIVSILDGYV